MLTRSKKSAALAALLLLTAAALRADEYVSNLNESVTSSMITHADLWTAVGFTTDNSALNFTLNSVTINNGAPLTEGITFFTAIYSNASGNPGVNLETLAGSANPGAGNTTYTSAGLQLDPNTTYWVVTGVGSTPGTYTRNYTSSADSLGAWTIFIPPLRYSGDHGGTWDSQSGIYLLFSVDATPVPEPSTYALLAGAGALGLAFWRRRRAR